MTSVFDEVADQYDRIRPRYPDALFDDLIALAHIPDRGRILEVGCGTGQATAGIAPRGYPLTCLEPGLKMAALARRNLAAFPNVALVQQTLEEFSADPGRDDRFDLVMSAQAFHWVARDVRFELAANALRPGGAMGLIAHHPDRSDSPIRRELDVAYRQFAPSLANGSDPLRRQVEEDFAASPRFRVLPVRTYRWSRVYASDEYLSLLLTHSDHIRLPLREREALIDGLRQVLAAHGGEIRVDYDTHLVVGYRMESHR